CPLLALGSAALHSPLECPAPTGTRRRVRRCKGRTDRRSIVLVPDTHEQILRLESAVQSFRHLAIAGKVARRTGKWRPTFHRQDERVVPLHPVAADPYATRSCCVVLPRAAVLRDPADD